MADKIARYATYTVVGLALLVLLLLGVGLSTSTASFSAYNTAWDGATNIESAASSAGIEATIATTTEAAYEQPSATVVILLSPDQPYTDAEQSRIREFVTEGGTLLVAEDFGVHTTSLLQGVGARSRIDGRLLRDERRFYRTPNNSLAYGTNNTTLVESGETLTLNHGTAVRPNGTTILVASSEFSYLDTNRNYALDDSETLQSRPIVTRESIGQGTVLVVSDPSIFINAMSEQPGNRAFIRNIFQRHSRAVVDYSHSNTVPPLFSWLFWLRETPLAQLVFGLISLLGVGLATTHRNWITSRVHKKDPVVDVDRDSIVSYLRAEYPEWDTADIGRVITGVFPNEAKRDDND